MLSPKALELLSQLFNEKSNLQLPVATAAEVVEIREWLQEQTQQLISDTNGGTSI